MLEGSPRPNLGSVLLCMSYIVRSSFGGRPSGVLGGNSVSLSDIVFRFNLNIWPSQTCGLDFVAFPVPQPYSLVMRFLQLGLGYGRWINRTQVFADRMFWLTKANISSKSSFCQHLWAAAPRLFYSAKVILGYLVNPKLSLYASLRILLHSANLHINTDVCPLG